jgi:hypothetical protein
MKPNVGRIDGVIRIVLGLLLLSLLFVLDDNTRWIGLIGVIVLATGLVRRCPLYIPFRIDTRERKLAGGTGH